MAGAKTRQAVLVGIEVRPGRHTSATVFEEAPSPQYETLVSNHGSSALVHGIERVDGASAMW